MKVICWNEDLLIKAENDQDAHWLFNYAKDLCSNKGIEDIIELEIGEFDWDGKLDTYGTMYFDEFRKEIKNETFGSGAVYIETDYENKTGETGQVVSININPNGF